MHIKVSLVIIFFLSTKHAQTLKLQHREHTARRYVAQRKAELCIRVAHLLSCIKVAHLLSSLCLFHAAWIHSTGLEINDDTVLPASAMDYRILSRQCR